MISKKKKKKKKKKRSSPKFKAIFLPKFRKFKRFRGGSFRMGGLFSIFHRKSASKAQKTCDFAYFTSQWGGLEPPPPPPPGYATATNPNSATMRFISFFFLIFYALLLNHKTSKSNFCVKLLSCKRNFFSRKFLGQLHREPPKNHFFEWLNLRCQFVLISVNI